MKLLFSCGGSYVSGMEIVELAIMRGLKERGHHIHALVSGWNNGDFTGRLEGAGIPYTVAFTGKLTLRKPAWMLETLRHLPGARRAARSLARTLRPDVVVACNRDALLLLAGVFAGTPIVYHAHETMAPKWISRVARFTDHVAAVSRFVAETYVAAGVDRDRVSVVHNGVDPVATRAERLPNTPLTLGICGQVGPWKGHDDLVDALAIVAERGIPFRLNIYGCGDSAYTESLKQRARAKGIADHIHWMGFERDLDQMYADLDLLVAPSRCQETFGMTLAEAGVRGVPAVATRVGGIPEVVADGETGRLVPPHDPAALADALSLLLGDEEVRQAMGYAARARVEEGFLTYHMVDRFEAALLHASSSDLPQLHTSWTPLT